jgi:putative Holliday junction resolvase
VRVLALDHGTVRIGCALSDPSGTLATPLPVIEPPEPAPSPSWSRARGRARSSSACPCTSAARRAARPALARSFCAELEAMLTVPVVTYDERLTTKMADASRRAGASAPRDSIAAAHLLQAYLAGQAAIGEGEL